MRITIFGFGVLGSTTYHNIRKNNPLHFIQIIDPKFFNRIEILSDNPSGDNPSGNNPMGNNPMGNNPMGNNPMGDEILKSDISFICVDVNNNPMGNNPMGNNPMGNNLIDDNTRKDNTRKDNTRKDNTQNLNNVYDCLDKCKSKKVVIRSTILPENITLLKEKYPHLDILTLPSFLTENDSFETDEMSVLGFENYLDYEMIRDIFGIEFLIAKPEEAMALKYIRNILGCFKVCFWNTINERFNDLDFRKLVKLFENLEILKPQGNLNLISPDGKKGFGGKCFPKDLGALMMSCKDNSFEKNILENIYNNNNKIRE